MMEPAAGPVVCFAMSEAAFRTAVDSVTLDRLAQVASVVRDDDGAPVLIQDFDSVDRAMLRDVEVLVTGWGAPRLDADTMPFFEQLRAVVHAAGSVKGILDPCVWDAGVAVSTAAEVNAIPVAEFTLATVILACKRLSRHVAAYKDSGEKRAFDENLLVHGTNGATVGVVGASRIGRRVLDLLRMLDVSVLVSDPFLEPADARSAEAELVDLPELLERSDVVTLHAPELPTTRHLIDDAALGRMRDGAVLINTARGSLVDTTALVPHVVSGRLDAYLDVTDPEPLPADSPLFGLPNVLLTPHIAGSMGNEVLRMGSVAVDEVERVANGQSLRFPVQVSELTHIA